ncbi:hypothetical protein ASF10_15095 [Flavobacterium sp. Leaf82]|nr:hypothetical protein ASF10_15095 [Flavobacterium sp. Leaf82]
MQGFKFYFILYRFIKKQSPFCGNGFIKSTVQSSPNDAGKMLYNFSKLFYNYFCIMILTFKIITFLYYKFNAS